MKELAFATIESLRTLIDSKKISPEEVLDYTLARFAQLNPKLNCALEVFDRDSILKMFASPGPLAGIPGLLKDNIAQKGRLLTCSSKILSNYVAPYDATVTTRLKDAGSFLMGRANCDEFAMGCSNEYSSYGPVANPWNYECVAGGSSGGSVAAVAAGLVPWALGTETGGSVRLPAAFCGVVGLKPTYGLVSRSGLVAYASSLDQAGVATRTVKDNARILSIIAGIDAHDSSTVPVVRKDYTRQLDGSMPSQLTIGILDTMVEAEGVDKRVHALIRQVIDQLQRMGIRTKQITIPSLEYSAAVYFIVSRAEAASNLARFDGIRYGYSNRTGKTLDDLYRSTRRNGFGDEVRSRILIGNYVLSAGHADEYYNNAKRVQAAMIAEIQNAFTEVDLLLAPTQAAPAFKFGTFNQNPLQLDLLDYFTCFSNLTGIPALSIPCGFVDNLPIGFQLIGPRLSEELIYRIAHAYEQATEWHTYTPV